MFSVVCRLLLSMTVCSVTREAAANSFPGQMAVDQSRAVESGQTGVSSGATDESMSGGRAVASEWRVPAWSIWLLGAIEFWLAGWVFVWFALLIVAPDKILEADAAMRKITVGNRQSACRTSLTFADLTFVSSFARHPRVIDDWVNQRASAVNEWLSIEPEQANTEAQEISVRVDGQSISISDASTVRAMLPETPFLVAIHGDRKHWNDMILSVLLRQMISLESTGRMMVDRAIPVVLDRNCIERLRSSNGIHRNRPLWLQVVHNELCRIPGVAQSLVGNLLESLVQSRRIFPIVDQWSQTPIALQKALQSAVSSGELRCLAVFDDDDTIAEMSCVIRMRSVIEQEAVSPPSKPATFRENSHRSFGATLPRITDAGDVPDLIQSLKDSDADVRQSAANALGCLSVAASESVPELLALMNDPVTACRRAAVNALGAIGPASAQTVASITRAVRNDHRAVRAAACRALGAIGLSDSQVIAVLIDAVSDPDSKVRVQASRSLGSVGADSDKAVAALATALLDPTLDVRRNAVIALSAVGSFSDEARTAIEQATRDEDSTVRSVAELACSQVMRSFSAA